MNKKLTYSDLEKVFGVKGKTIQYRLKHGMSLQDALNEPVGYDKYEIIGRRYGRFIVENRIQGTNKYHCLCDCGNEFIANRGNITSGRQKSCGCLNMENRHAKHKDVSGQIINGTKVLYRTKDEISNGIAYIHYMFECPFCGNKFDARLNNVKSGNTRGCGCTRYQYVKFYDLTGMNFEFCHVNKRLPDQPQPSGSSRIIYECTCCCGKIYSDWAHTILHGRSNCGCKKIKSKGELIVQKYLDNHNISYVPQYWFDDLRGRKRKPLFFDFALFDSDNNLLGLVEYQGKQHYCEISHSIKDFGKQQRERTDRMKKKYCKANAIKLFEIAYYENTEQKCDDILKLLYHDNTVPSSQETA